MLMLEWCCFGALVQCSEEGVWANELLRCLGESDLWMQGDVILGAESQVFCILVEENCGACFYAEVERR